MMRLAASSRRSLEDHTETNLSLLYFHDGSLVLVVLCHGYGCFEHSSRCCSSGPPTCSIDSALPLTCVSPLSSLELANYVQKKQQDSMNSRLKLVMKSGKAILGYKAAIKSLRKSKSRMILIASNCPPLRKSEVEYLSMLAKTPVHHYTGDNTALGTACGKFFNCSILSIIDAGDSDILSSTGAGGKES